MLGLRPTLKTRPSFVDLIRTQSIEKLSRQRSLSAPNVDSETAQDFALPPSPLKQESIEEEIPAKEIEHKKTEKMAPSNIDGDETNGSVFSVSG